MLGACSTRPQRYCPPARLISAVLLCRELIECVRKVLLVGVLTFYDQGSLTQISLGLVVCVLSIFAYSNCKPYEVYLNDVLQWLCQFSVFAALLAALLLKYEEVELESESLLVILYALALTPLVLTVPIMVLEVAQQGGRPRPTLRRLRALTHRAHRRSLRGSMSSDGDATPQSRTMRPFEVNATLASSQTAPALLSRLPEGVHVEAVHARESVQSEIGSGRSSRFSGLASCCASQFLSRRASEAAAQAPHDGEASTRPRRGSARFLHMGTPPGSPARHNPQVSVTAERDPAAGGTPILSHSGAGSFEAAAREPRRATELSTTSL